MEASNMEANRLGIRITALHFAMDNQPESGLEQILSTAQKIEHYLETGDSFDEPGSNPLAYRTINTAMDQVQILSEYSQDEPSSQGMPK